LNFPCLGNIAVPFYHHFDHDALDNSRPNNFWQSFPHVPHQTNLKSRADACPCYNAPPLNVAALSHRYDAIRPTRDKERHPMTYTQLEAARFPRLYKSCYRRVTPILAPGSKSSIPLLVSVRMQCKKALSCLYEGV
jgi:hypothetical protein